MISCVSPYFLGQRVCPKPCTAIANRDAERSAGESTGGCEASIHRRQIGQGIRTKCPEPTLHFLMKKVSRGDVRRNSTGSYSKLATRWAHDVNPANWCCRCCFNR